MRRILKYSIPITRNFSIEMPRGSQLLHVAAQGAIEGGPQIWASVPVGEGVMDRRDFELIATGAEYEAATLIYLGTFIMDNGDFVAHVFEKLG